MPSKLTTILLSLLRATYISRAPPHYIIPSLFLTDPTVSAGRVTSAKKWHKPFKKEGTDLLTEALSVSGNVPCIERNPSATSGDTIDEDISILVHIAQ